MMISTKLNTISRRAFSPFAMSLRKEVEPEEIITTTASYRVDEALSLAIEASERKGRKFNETVDIAIQLNVDPRKPNQNVRGIVHLPNGTGKDIRIAVFARGEKAEIAKKLGVTFVGAEELVTEITNGNVNFDRIIATPDTMPLVGKVARILGPRGLMPNPKMGTVTMDVEKAIAEANSGVVEFRVEKKGNVYAGIGKVSFSQEALLDNIRAFMVALADAKPEGAKGRYIQQAHLSTTMGKGLPIVRTSIDPTSPNFFRF